MPVGSTGRRLRRHAADMVHRGRAPARHGGAEVLQLVGGRRRAGRCFHDRHLPVGRLLAADQRAERAPVRQRARRIGDPPAPAAAPAGIEMEAVARHAAAQRRRQRRRPALVVAARAAHAVGIDHGARVAERQVLAAHRRQHALIVDAGVGKDHAEARQRVRRASLERHDRLGLPDAGEAGEVGAARVGDGRHAHAPLRGRCCRQLLEERDARGAQRLAVGADVHLAHLDEILGIEELADRDLLLDRPAPRRAHFARQHPLLVIVQMQDALPVAAPG